MGKTALINQHVYRKFTDQYKSTVCPDFVTKEILIDDKLIMLQVRRFIHVYRFGTPQDSHAFVRWAIHCARVQMLAYWSMM